ncbi:hypothetical protein GS399_01390 [Pedobacter sp. HMF7647]|uniref:Uncharacterized protein n=1 Tax=Hufsiella arboris TaxID=2695275 RepID=A0A7K1Y5B4_9SPHI|nr:hypothetical protein [Hufsiella arboris]MXV49610.1 hypothetical protein [Hufsiella arboris]
MKKRIAKHIKNQDFVKVYITNTDDYEIDHFNGIIYEQNDKFILMCDTFDFNFDGFIVLRKSDISEIKCTENEKIFKQIIDNERITNSITKKRLAINVTLSAFKEMFIQLMYLKLPIIIECKYGKDDRFQIGPICEVDEKKVKLKHFNASGEFDLKPTTARYKEITFFRIDSPYANIFYKYAKEIE